MAEAINTNSQVSTTIKLVFIVLVVNGTAASEHFDTKSGSFEITHGGVRRCLEKLAGQPAMAARQSSSAARQTVKGSITHSKPKLVTALEMAHGQ
jgi:hypothetical protein